MRFTKLIISKIKNGNIVYFTLTSLIYFLFVWIITVKLPLVLILNKNVSCSVFLLIFFPTQVSILLIIKCKRVSRDIYVDKIYIKAHRRAYNTTNITHIKRVQILIAEWGGSRVCWYVGWVTKLRNSSVQRRVRGLSNCKFKS